MEYFIRTRLKGRRKILKEVQTEDIYQQHFQKYTRKFTATQECEILKFCSMSTISCQLLPPMSFIDVDIDTHTLHMHSLVMIFSLIRDIFHCQLA